jgi:hypothetical protein
MTTSLSNRIRRAVGLGTVLLATATVASGLQASLAAGAVDPQSTIPLLISEYRDHGPAGPRDEYIEITNVSEYFWPVPTPGFPVIVSNGTTLCTIPAGTHIPAHGSFLCVGGQYAHTDFSGFDHTMLADLEPHDGIALFWDSDPASIDLEHRIDAVGTSAVADPLFREGDGLPPLPDEALEYALIRDPKDLGDTDDNGADFQMVTLTSTSAAPPYLLGSPGPQSLTSPRSNARMTISPLDTCSPEDELPNLLRAPLSLGPNTEIDTSRVRRRLTNETGGAVTALRIRVVDITTMANPPVSSDIVVLPGQTTSAVPVDGEPCGDSPDPTSVFLLDPIGPAAVRGSSGLNTTLDGADLNAFLASPGGLGDGKHVDVEIVAGGFVEGERRLEVIVEVLTDGDDAPPHAGTCLVTLSPEDVGGVDRCAVDDPPPATTSTTPMTVVPLPSTTEAPMTPTTVAPLPSTTATPTTSTTIESSEPTAANSATTSRTPIVRSAALPRTGASAGQLLTLAGLLLACGGVLIAGSVRPGRRTD